MVDVIGEEPLVIVRELLASGWDNANTTYSSDPRFTTGWWDWGRDMPTVTVTNAQITSVSAATDTRTGYSYMTGDGRVGQLKNGIMLVNCWGGTFETPALDGEASDGERLSPKINAWEMCKEARRILLNNAEGTLADDGSVELSFVSPAEHRRLVDTDEDDEHPTLFRYELTTRYGYTEES